MYRIIIEPQGWLVDGVDDVTVMEAASLAGVLLPRSCQSGACRTCMCEMKQGSVRYPMEWPGLLKEEKKAGMILPCVAIPESDLVIHAPAARLAPGYA